jgi:hypothetical protein
MHLTEAGYKLYNLYAHEVCDHMQGKIATHAMLLSAAHEKNNTPDYTVLHSSVRRVTYREHITKYMGQSARRLGYMIDDRGIGFRSLARAIKPCFLHSLHRAFYSWY